jgi:hypothetical protein
MVTKLYCYVDETGQDTGGELFLVAVVLKEITALELLEKKLEKINLFYHCKSCSGKGKRKLYCYSHY